MVEEVKYSRGNKNIFFRYSGFFLGYCGIFEYEKSAIDVTADLVLFIVFL